MNLFGIPLHNNQSRSSIVLRFVFAAIAMLALWIFAVPPLSSEAILMAFAVVLLLTVANYFKVKQVAIEVPSSKG